MYTDHSHAGAHTVGGCKADRSGFEGHWTENPHVFDNGYFREMLAKKYEPMTVAATGNPQHKHWWPATMLETRPRPAKPRSSRGPV